MDDLRDPALGTLYWFETSAKVRKFLDATLALDETSFEDSFFLFGDFFDFDVTRLDDWRFLLSGLIESSI